MMPCLAVFILELTSKCYRYISRHIFNSIGKEWFVQEHHDLDDFMPEETAETYRSLEVQEKFQGFIAAEPGTLRENVLIDLVHFS
jgi:hypothetical protein